MVNKPVGARQRLSVEARRSQLVAVGVRLIATQSWDTLTMSAIARSAGVSKPLLYHYFSTKDDLYLAAVRSAAEQLRMATKPDLTLPLDERLRRGLEAHVDWVENNAFGYRAVLQGGASGDPAIQAIVEESRTEVIQVIASATGASRPSAALRIALRGWVGFLEAACLEWLTAKQIPKSQLVQLLAASLSAAVAATHEETATVRAHRARKVPRHPRTFHVGM